MECRETACVGLSGPGGAFVFSVEHPIYVASSSPAWLTLADGRKVWPLDSYRREEPRSTEWLVPGVIKQHRTLGTTLNLIVEQGFTIRQVEEQRPSSDQNAATPEAAEEIDRPVFLLIATDCGST